jgi:hypothetical protein
MPPTVSTERTIIIKIVMSSYSHMVSVVGGLVRMRPALLSLPSSKSLELRWRGWLMIRSDDE